MKKDKIKPGGVVTHGVEKFRKSGILPDEHKDLLPILNTVRKNILSDLGSIESLSQSQLLLVDSAVSILACKTLIERFIAKEGAFRGSRLQPVLAQNYISFVNTLQRLLRELGLERKADKSGSLQDYIALKQKDKKT